MHGYRCTTFVRNDSIDRRRCPTITRSLDSDRTDSVANPGTVPIILQNWVNLIRIFSQLEEILLIGEVALRIISIRSTLGVVTANVNFSLIIKESLIAIVHQDRYEIGHHIVRMDTRNRQVVNCRVQYRRPFDRRDLYPGAGRGR